MKLDKRHLVVSIVLMVASLIYSVWAFQQTGAKKPVVASSPVAAAADAPVPAPAVAGAAQPIDPTQIPPLPDVALDRLPQWSRNPFASTAPPVAEVVATTQPVTTEAEPDVVVSLILQSPTRRTALVNGVTVHVGDLVGTSRVVDIQPNAIVLQAPSGTQRTIERRRWK